MLYVLHEWANEQLINKLKEVRLRGIFTEIHGYKIYWCRAVQINLVQYVFAITFDE